MDEDLLTKDGLRWIIESLLERNHRSSKEDAFIRICPTTFVFAGLFCVGRCTAVSGHPSWGYEGKRVLRNMFKKEKRPDVRK